LHLGDGAGEVLGADQNDFLKTVVPWLKKIDSKV